MAADYPHKIMADVNRVKLTGTRLESAVAAYSAKNDSKKGARPFLTEGSMNRFLTGRAAPVTPANLRNAAVYPDLKHSSQKSALFFPFTRIQSNRWQGQGLGLRVFCERQEAGRSRPSSNCEMKTLTTFHRLSLWCPLPKPDHPHCPAYQAKIMPVGVWRGDSR